MYHYKSLYKSRYFTYFNLPQMTALEVPNMLYTENMWHN